MLRRRQPCSAYFVCYYFILNTDAVGVSFSVINRVKYYHVNFRHTSGQCSRLGFKQRLGLVNSVLEESTACRLRGQTVYLPEISQQFWKE